MNEEIHKKYDSMNGAKTDFFTAVKLSIRKKVQEEGIKDVNGIYSLELKNPPLLYPDVEEGGFDGSLPQKLETVEWDDGLVNIVCEGFDSDVEDYTAESILRLLDYLENV